MPMAHAFPLRSQSDGSDRWIRDPERTELNRSGPATRLVQSRNGNVAADDLFESRPFSCTHPTEGFKPMSYIVAKTLRIVMQWL